jgi:ribonuclease R
MDESKITPESVLAALRASAPRAVHQGELTARLDARMHRAEVERVLDDLADAGLVRELPGRRFKLAERTPRSQPSGHAGSGARGRARGTDSKSRWERDSVGRVGDSGRASRGDEVRGKLSLTERGFGFVAADDGGADVFVPAPAVGGAMHGDRVRVRVRWTPKGREGEVVAIEERGVQRIVGILRRAGRAPVLEPEDARIRGPCAIEGRLPPGAEEGHLVLAHVLRPPETNRDPVVVRVVQNLGKAGVASVEIAAIKAREGIVEEFPPEVVAHAEALPEEVSEDDKARREDLRHLDLCTIDPEDARDHDDAVWAERTADGWRVVVAIADVSHYVRPGTPLDAEAAARGCSIYLPDRAIPMLPHQLSTNLASLLPGVDRLTMAVECHVSRAGAVRSFRYVEGVMRSRAKLTYETVAHALGLGDDLPSSPEAEAWKDRLAILLEVSEALRARRRRRGSLDFDLPEPRVTLDPESGEPVDVHRSRSHPGVRRAYAMVEDLMLLANETVAADLARRGVPTIYRVHGPPSPKKIEVFARLAAALGHELDEDALEDPRRLQRFLAEIEGSPMAQPLSMLLLRSMQQATYDVTNIGHFGLAAREYLHFTSPIRRYPDLAVHRVVRALFRGDDVREEEWLPRLAEWAAASSRLERRAMEAERDAIDVYRAILMRDRVGEVFEGTITGVQPWGVYVATDTPYVEILVNVETLSGGGESFDVDDLGIALVGRRSGRRFALGDRLSVELTSVNVSRRALLGRPAVAAARAVERHVVASEPQGSDAAPGADAATGEVGSHGQRGAVVRPTSRHERPRLAATSTRGKARSPRSEVTRDGRKPKLAAEARGRSARERGAGEDVGRGHESTAKRVGKQSARQSGAGSEKRRAAEEAQRRGKTTAKRVGKQSARQRDASSTKRGEAKPRAKLAPGGKGGRGGKRR